MATFYCPVASEQEGALLILVKGKPFRKVFLKVRLILRWGLAEEAGLWLDSPPAQVVYV